MVAIEVGRDQRLFAKAENAFQRPGSSCFQGLVDLLLGGVASDFKGDVNQRYIGRRDSDGQPVQLAFQGGKDEPDGLRRAGRGRNHTQRRSTCAAQVFMRQVEDALIVGVRVDRRHQTVLDAKGIVEHLGDRSQAVGRAAAVGDDFVLLFE